METEEIKKEVKREIILELIIDKLFSALVKSGNKIEVEIYNIDEKDITYLLQKYDEEKFKEYEKMLLKDRGEEDE